MGIEIKPRKALAFAKAFAANPELPLVDQARIAGVNVKYARHIKAGRVRPEKPHKLKSVAKLD